MAEILSAWPGSYGVASIIPEREPLRLEDQEVTYEAIPVLPMNNDEKELFVRFAETVGDGEAATLALALSRNAVPATDDRRAINFWRRQSTGQLLETPDLMDLWARTHSPTPQILSGAIIAIERRARFRPASRHPSYPRWEEMRGSA